jgi:hypothetical protein
MALHPNEDCSCVPKTEILDYFELYYKNTTVNCLEHTECLSKEFWNSDSCSCEIPQYMSAGPDLECEFCVDERPRCDPYKTFD